MTPEELAGKLEQIVVAAAAPEAALEKIALVVEGRAKKNSPVGKTGNLQRSNRGVVQSPNVVALQNSAEYSPYVQYGTEHMAARPFATDAIEQSEGDIETIMQQYGVQILDKVGGV